MLPRRELAEEPENIRVPNVARGAGLAGDGTEEIGGLIDVQQVAGAIELLDTVVNVTNPEVTRHAPGQVQGERRRGEEAGDARRCVQHIDLGAEHVRVIDEPVGSDGHVVRVAAHEVLAQEVSARVDVEDVAAVHEPQPERAVPGIKGRTLPARGTRMNRRPARQQSRPACCRLRSMWTITPVKPLASPRT